MKAFSSSKIKALAVTYLAMVDACDTVILTDDGHSFVNENYAKNHVRDLENISYTEFEREDLTKEIEAEKKVQKAAAEKVAEARKSNADQAAKAAELLVSKEKDVEAASAKAKKILDVATREAAQKITDAEATAAEIIAGAEGMEAEKVEEVLANLNGEVKHLIHDDKGVRFATAGEVGAAEATDIDEEADDSAEEKTEEKTEEVEIMFSTEDLEAAKDAGLIIYDKSKGYLYGKNSLGKSKDAACQEINNNQALANEIVDAVEASKE